MTQPEPGRRRRQALLHIDTDLLVAVDAYTAEHRRRSRSDTVNHLLKVALDHLGAESPAEDAR